jgi:uncharacterized circularly permuted ATP-grasp superfamily protein
MTHVFPELFASHPRAPVADYPSRLLEVLRDRRPGSRIRPSLLTPGVHNAAYFEHSFLARQMGIELVEGRDLVCRENRVYMRTTASDEPVHVVYRCADDEYLDPLHFRADSVLGCAGLLNVTRGKCVDRQFPGNGVADDKAIYPRTGDDRLLLLGERPVLDNVETYDLADADGRAWALARLDRLVWKPVDGSGRLRTRDRPCAPESQLVDLMRSVVEDPRLDRPGSSRCRRLRPTRTAPWGRHVDLRPFACTTGTGCGSRPVAHPPRSERQLGRELRPGRRIEGHLVRAATDAGLDDIDEAATRRRASAAHASAR